MNFFDYILELEQEFESKKGIFKKIDAQKCVDIIQKMKKDFPEAMKEAEYILNTKQKLLESADEMARRIISETEAEAKRRLDETGILEAAEAEARKIIESALVRCEKLTFETRAHLDNVFGEVEEFLNNTSRMINKNRGELEDALSFNRK